MTNSSMEPPAMEKGNLLISVIENTVFTCFKYTLYVYFYYVLSLRTLK